MLFIVGSGAKGQLIEDALRYSRYSPAMTPRAAALGEAYYGLSDDFSALFYNPAGLTLVRKSEINVGFGFNSGNSTSNFLGNSDKIKYNTEFLTNIGFVIPFKTSIGSASIGLGYALEKDFKNDIHGEGFNSKSTLILDYTNNTPKTVIDNMGAYLYLADTTFFKTPIKDSLQQSFDAYENGGIHDIVLGGAFDISENVSVGATILGKFGTYKYQKTYTESDIYNIYNQRDEPLFRTVDFDYLVLDQTIKQDISGITGSIGIMGRFKDFMRFGVTLKLPTYYEIDETYSEYAVAHFDDGSYTTPAWGTKATNSYKITTPFTYSAGMSIFFEGLAASFAIQYSDLSQMEFKGASDLEALNRTISRDLGGQTTLGVGMEYDFPESIAPLVLRGGFSNTSSPYSKEISGTDIKNYSFGLGYYFAPNIRLDGVYRLSEYSQLRSNYSSGEGSQYSYDAKVGYVGIQLTYRY